MKLSLKLQDNHHHERHHQPPPPPPPLLIRAKIPITIFNLPFLSHFSTTTTQPSDLSLSLSTNFPSFPSLKLSYASASAAAAPPLTLTLKSGTGLFGSPNNSPLVISAHFSFDPSNPAHPNPTFSLLLKPQLGSFSLRKSTFSHPEPAVSAESIIPDAVCDSNSFGFVPLETPAAVKELPPQKKSRASIFKGTQLAATTQMPVAKGVALNLRWRVNFAEDQMPILRINKIGIHRVDDAVKGDEKSEKNEAKLGEMEVMKSMCFWMKREVDALTRANREMKIEFDELRRRSSGGAGGGNVNEGARSGGGGFGGGNVKEGGIRKKKAVAAAPMKQWKGEENGKREEKKNGNVAIDVESELQRAIMAAAASPST
ncbi:uncharacterized protein LOC130994281 [Salvia miltiorrhiza]|uniref:uncharacterized protein LOC130994281 n=1 Tax=Salvia miltiorrhiza TaxID=226208 RepID=UPI0025AD8609|nr:uncharacterized protein LOC130994281 [Salvia miltiorrhiza]